MTLRFAVECRLWDILSLSGRANVGDRSLVVVRNVSRTLPRVRASLISSNLDSANYNGYTYEIARSAVRQILVEVRLVRLAAVARAVEDSRRRRPYRPGYLAGMFSSAPETTIPPCEYPHQRELLVRALHGVWAAMRLGMSADADVRAAAASAGTGASEGLPFSRGSELTCTGYPRTLSLAMSLFTRATRGSPTTMPNWPGSLVPRASPVSAKTPGESTYRR